MIEVRTHEPLYSQKCSANNSTCTREPTLEVTVRDEKQFAAKLHNFLLCTTCAKSLFNALGFMITSQTGESIERLVGLKRRKGDRK